LHGDIGSRNHNSWANLQKATLSPNHDKSSTISHCF